VQRQQKSLHGENAIVLHRYRIIYVGQVERSLRGQRGSRETAAAVRLEGEQPIFAESTLLGLLKTRAWANAWVEVSLRRPESWPSRNRTVLKDFLNETKMLRRYLGDDRRGICATAAQKRAIRLQQAPVSY
jgi:hypothetical protein